MIYSDNAIFDYILYLLAGQHRSERTENDQFALGLVLAVPVLSLQRVDTGVLPGGLLHAEVGVVVDILDLCTIQTNVSGMVYAPAPYTRLIITSIG